MDVNPVLDEWLPIIFRNFVGCILTLLIVSFAEQKLFSLI
jgi:hypothetical protein